MSSITANIRLSRWSGRPIIMPLMLWLLSNVIGGVIGAFASHVITDEAYRGVVIWVAIGLAQGIALTVILPALFVGSNKAANVSQWALVSALGGLAAVVLFRLTTALLFDTGEEKPLTEAFLAGTWVIAGAGAVGGAALGLAQYLILRRAVQEASLWIIANAAAWSLSLVIGAGLLERYVVPIVFPGKLFYWSAAFGAVYGYGPPSDRILSSSVVMAAQALLTGIILMKLLNSARTQRGESLETSNAHSVRGGFSSDA